MRVYLLAAAAALCLAAPIKADAAPLPAAQSQSVGQAAQEQVQLVARRCGRHAHFVRGHRGRHGRWIPGRCVRNR